MSSGSSDSNNEASTQAAVMQPVPTATFDTSQAQNAGRTYTPQTFTKEAKPAWMTGAWDMPTWGTNAATGAALTQPVKPVQAPVVQQPVVQQQTPSTDRSFWKLGNDSSYAAGGLSEQDLFRQRMLSGLSRADQSGTAATQNLLQVR